MTKNKEAIYKFNGVNFKLQLRDDTDQSVVAEIFKWREYRSADEIIKGLDKGVILDVGAHIGIFTLYCHALNPLSTIYSLEPNKDNYLILKKHLEDNKILNAHPRMIALAEKTESRKLAITADNHNHYLAKNNTTEQAITVSAKSLADFCHKNRIGQIGLLKMDIESGEYEIFANLKKEEFRLIDSVILEYHNYNGHNYKELEATLRQNSFGVQIFPSGFDKKMGFILARKH